MAEARVEHVYDCDVDTFWNKIALNVDFNRKLYLEHLEFQSWDQLSFEETENEIRRSVDVAPPAVDLPTVLKKLVKGGIRYRQDDVFDKSTGKMSTQITPDVATDRISITGETVATPESDDRCRRVFTMTVKVKMIGVSGIAEKRILSEMRRGYDAGAEYANSILRSGA